MSEHNQPHWSNREEAGSVLGIKILLSIYRLLGRRVFLKVLDFVMAYYHFTEKPARQGAQIMLIK